MKRLKNLVYRVRQFFPNLYFKKLLKQPHYRKIDNSQLVINWLFQRVFRINSEVPYSLHYSSKVQGADRIIFKGNPESAKISLAVSGGCYFTVFHGSTLEIGEDTLWAFNVCIQTGNHDFIDRNKYKTASVKIGNNCWIGNSVTILAGVELGDNITVGANSVVTKSFPSNCVIAGCPAKIIKELK